MKYNKKDEGGLIKIVHGMIGSDVHAIGNSIIETILRDCDYIEQVNLGVMNSKKEFVNAAQETGADSVWVSSLYGHAEMDCKGLKDMFVEKGLDDVILYLGGNLTIGKDLDSDSLIKKYKDMGFDRVYPLCAYKDPKDMPLQALKDVYNDVY